MWKRPSDGQNDGMWPHKRGHYCGVKRGRIRLKEITKRNKNPSVLYWLLLCVLIAFVYYYASINLRSSRC